MRFRPGVRSQSISALAAADLVEVIPALDLYRYRLAGPAGGDLATTLAQLNAESSIDFAEPNFLIAPDFSPDDPSYRNYAAESIAIRAVLSPISAPTILITATTRRTMLRLAAVISIACTWRAPGISVWAIPPSSWP